MDEKEILFTEVQRRLIQEVMNRNQRDLDEVLNLVFKEIGIDEKVKAGESWMLMPQFVGVRKVEPKRETTKEV